MYNIYIYIYVEKERENFLSILERVEGEKRIRLKAVQRSMLHLFTRAVSGRPII